MKNWKAIVGAVGVFLLGMFAGGLVTAKLFQHRIAQVLRGDTHVVRETIIRRLSWYLRLDRGQREQLRAIVTASQTEMQSVRKQIHPEVEEVLSRAETKVREILRPEQRERFDRLVAERRAKWKGQ